MRYFKDENNSIFAYNDNVKQEVIKPNLTEITTDEYKSFKVFKVFDKTIEEVQEELDNKKFNSLQTNLLNELKKIANDKLTQSTINSETISEDIDVGRIALDNINNLIDILADGETINFRLADNSFKELSKDDLIGIKKECVLTGNQVYQTKWKLEEDIKAITSSDELEATKIDFENQTLTN